MAVNHLMGYVIKGYGTGMETYSSREQQGDDFGHFGPRMNRFISAHEPISTPGLDPGVLVTAHGHSRMPTILVDGLEHAQTLLLQRWRMLTL